MNSKTSYYRSCPICTSDSQEIVLPLAATPLGDRLSDSFEKATSLPKYALELALCNNCGHTFLPLVVAPEESYGDYFFETSDSPGLSDSMQRIAEQLWRDCSKSKNNYVLDIGSNDGTWLQHFKNLGASVLGIEPSPRHAQEATARGVETNNGYFSIQSASEIRKKFGAPSLITANFVTANVPDLANFFQGLKDLSDDNTTIAILSGYHPDQFRVNMIDFIYHEHVSYFSCQDFINLGEKFGLDLVEIRRVGLKGGSIQAIFRTKSSRASVSGDVGRLAQYEEWVGIRHASWFADINDRIKKAQSETHRFLDAVKADKIAGYGVSHSVTTLIYQFDLVDRIKVLTDDNPRRQGKFAPGSGLTVISPQKVVNDEFDTVIIMAWQHDRLIKNRLSKLDYPGSVIQPLPAAELVNLSH
ncbi:MAG: methyltransferase domain-containing protein [Actinobacteria bacterium]|nr:methyltransferase domain-containing protein [Actinomycetota bacterium]